MGSKDHKGRDWQCADALFDELLQLDESERQVRLAEISNEQPGLAPLLVRLLESATDHHAIDQVLLAALKHLASEDRTGPRRLGPWRLKSRIGHGGMSQVFLADRADDTYEQQAAVKLMWPGMAGPDSMARFEQERQILASLDDPRIARLVDGGVTEDGRPWLAMEYVQGMPVDRYCDRYRLDIDARLALFLEIAAAVAAAHRRLVVHRDIKPDNVLVQCPESSDGDPALGRVKLLDFGIAKLLDTDSLPHAAPATRRAERLLTPEYASPEQLTELPISTASDVYQLGALLFKLLAGEPPQSRRGLTTAEFEQRVLAEDPPRPSLRVRGLDPHSAEAEAMFSARRLTRKGLINRLHGDLDAIVMQAMARQPEARYGSVEQLMADIERHMNDVPVLARRQTLAYRAGRFFSRHKWPTAIAAAFAALLLAYAGTVTWQAGQLVAERDQVRQQAIRAERVRDFLISIYQAADPFGPERGQINTHHLLENSVERIHQQLAEDPEVRAELLSVIGHIYLQYSEPERAQPLLAEALAIRSGLHDKDHADLAQSIYLHAAWLTRMGDYAAAEREARRALAMRESLFGRNHVDYLTSLGQVGVIMMYAGRFREAEPFARETLALRQTIGHSEDVGLSLNAMGIILTGLGRYEEAENSYREGIAIRETLYAPHQAQMATIPHNLAVNLMHQGRHEEAETLLREALALRRDAHAEGHPRITYTLDNLGRVVRLLGRTDEAESYHREAQELRRRFKSHDHRNTARGLHALGRLAEDRGALEEAERYYLESLAHFQSHGLGAHPSAGDVRIALGWLWLRQGRLDEAAPLLEEALTVHHNASGEDSDFSAQARVALALLRAAQGREQEARELIASGLAQLQRYALADPEMLAEASRLF